MQVAVPQQGKAEAIQGLIPALLHRNIPLPTDRVRGTLILLLPAQGAAVIPLLQDHIPHLPQDLQVAAQQGQAAAAAVAQSPVEEAAEAAAVEVHIVVVVEVHAEAGNNL